MFSSQRENQLPQNDPRLSELVKVRALRPFCLRGKAQLIGETCTVERHVGDDLIASGRAELAR